MFRKMFRKVDYFPLKSLPASADQTSCNRLTASHALKYPLISPQESCTFTKALQPLGLSPWEFLCLLHQAPQSTTPRVLHQVSLCVQKGHLPTTQWNLVHMECLMYELISDQLEMELYLSSLKLKDATQCGFYTEQGRQILSSCKCPQASWLCWNCLSPSSQGSTPAL